MQIDFSNPVFTADSQRTWPPLLNLKQTAQILNVSIWTLRKWDNEGKLKAVRIGTGKHRRYKKEDIIKILQEGL
ncbi:MAG: helix-turn-helix domain-containing protein [Patescibacteria group bacterium]